MRSRREEHRFDDTDCREKNQELKENVTSANAVSAALLKGKKNLSYHTWTSVARRDPAEGRNKRGDLANFDDKEVSSCPLYCSRCRILD